MQLAQRLPSPFDAWFATRGWTPYPHQLKVLQAFCSERIKSTVLLIAPTGGGKTLAGFLPALADLAKDSRKGLRALYVSPLKALVADVRRNLLDPIESMPRPIRCEIRSGDTTSAQRRKQLESPPSILLTTPESLALISSYEEPNRVFGALDWLIIDEIHAIADTKRGDLLSLNVARLRSLRPELKIIALSATVADPAQVARWLEPACPQAVHIIDVSSDPELAVAESIIEVLTPEFMPWSGHAGLHAVEEILKLIASHQVSIIFVNTRAQAERLYHEIQRINTQGFAIGLHHGSLEKELRLEVESAMAAGKLRAVVATSSLDLGIDWGAVDLVVQVGPPKGVARLMQRIGRSNHRLDKASRAILIPTNRMEAIETVAAIEAIRLRQLDNEFLRVGALDALSQHLVGRILSEPVSADALYDEVRAAGPYSGLSRQTFERVLELIRHGGFALKAYESFHRIREREDGRLEVANPRVARRHRMNVGTIVGYPHLKVRFRRGRNIGEIEERFVQNLQPGDHFIFGGRILRFDGLRDMTVTVSPARNKNVTVIPAFAGGKLPLSSRLARDVRARIADPTTWGDLPEETREWLELQHTRSALPSAEELLVELFPRSKLHFLVAYPFAGKNAHQTLGLVVSRKLAELDKRPLGFVTNDYGIAVWSLEAVEEQLVPSLFDPTLVRTDIGEWMHASYLLKRTFREVAIVSGLIDRKLPGKEKTGRQVTFSSDILYETLKRYDPDHILLEAARIEAGRGLIQSDRLQAVLEEFHGKIKTKVLDRISPFAVSVVLEVGRESIDGGSTQALLDLNESELLAEAGLLPTSEPASS